MKKIIYNCLFLFFICINNNILAEKLNIELDVLSENYVPINVLMFDFYADSSSKKLYEKLKNIINFDLNNTGLLELKTINEEKFNIDFNIKEVNIDLSLYEFYKVIMMGKFIEKNDFYTIEVAFLDTSNNSIIQANGYKISKKDINQQLSLVAHNIADDFYELSTKLKPYFSNSLAFVSDNKLIVSDYDGKNQNVLVKSAGTIYGPQFSNNGQYLAYVESLGGISKIYLYDFYFQKSIKLADFEGLSLSPRFSADSKKLIFSISNKGSANIFELNLETKEVNQLTSHYSINLPGGYVLGDEKIIFYSDRLAASNIFIMDSKGENIKKISGGSGSYFTPTISPIYDIIAFTKIYNKNFYIGLLSLDGREKIISKEIFAESPSWLPDGRHIVYQHIYKKYNKINYYAITILDIISGAKLQINPTENAMDPVISKNKLLNKKINVKYSL
jgi:TolB protein